MEAVRRARRVLSGFVLVAPTCVAILASIPALAFPRVHSEGAPLPDASSMQDLEVRGAVLSRGIGVVEDYYQTRVLPVERILEPYGNDAPFVRSVSMALVAEAEDLGIDPRALASVLLVENPWLDPNARSSVGAVGLMQVMPFHAGARLCNSEDLVDVDSNICHGTLILARNLRATSTSTAALLRYNGCVRGTNTPDCHRYPGRVLARASRVRREILAGAPIQIALR
jgi:hypothetical protein